MQRTLRSILFQSSKIASSITSLHTPRMFRQLVLSSLETGNVQIIRSVTAGVCGRRKRNTAFRAVAIRAFGFTSRVRCNKKVQPCRDSEKILMHWERHTVACNISHALLAANVIYSRPVRMCNFSKFSNFCAARARVREFCV